MIRREVIDDYGEELRPGTGLILKDLVIYTPKNESPFVNVSKNTIASMYCNDPSGVSASGETIIKLTKDEKNFKCKLIVGDEMQIFCWIGCNFFISYSSIQKQSKMQAFCSDK